MELSASDIEAIDAVIDGGATAADAERVRALSADPATATVLQQRRVDRAARTAVFASLEPDDATLERFHWRLAGEMADARLNDRVRQRVGSRWGMSRVGSAAAACVVIGFFGGWMGRGRPAIAPSNGAQPVTHTPDDGAPSPVATQGQSTPVDIMVPVSNEYGQVVAYQKFHNPADATRFTEDMNRANGGSSSTPPTDDRVKLLTGEKY